MTMRSKRTWICRGGPLNGKIILLTVSDDGRTAIFTIAGKTGYYQNGRWVACDLQNPRLATVGVVGTNPKVDSVPF